MSYMAGDIERLDNSFGSAHLIDIVILSDFLEISAFCVDVYKT
jgi:hypothetical protein